MCESHPPPEDPASWETLRLALDAARNAMVLVDRAGEIVLLNECAGSLLGYQNGELLGQAVETLIPERFRQPHRRWVTAFVSAPARKATNAGRDMFALRKDGIEIPVETSLHPLTVGGRLFVLTSLLEITERKRTEELLQLAMESSPVPMLVANPEGIVVSVNSATERLVGCPRRKLAGQSLELLFPPRFRENHGRRQNSFFAQLSLRATGGRELFALRADGAEVPIEITLNPIRTSDGPFVVASVVDTTERKRSEQHRRLYQALVEGVRDYGILMLDPQGHILSWNSGAERLKGYSAGEILGQHFSRFYLPEDIAEGRPQRELKIAEAEGKYEDEGWRLRRDGSRFWASILLTAVHDSDGNLSGFAKLTRDITQRRESDEKLRQNEKEIRQLLIEAGERKFQGVLEAAPDAIVVVNSEGRIVLVNGQVEALFGYRRDDLLGREVEVLLPSAFREKHRAERDGFFVSPRSRRMYTVIDLFGLRQDGSQFPAEIRLSPVPSAEGMLVAASVRDVTERKHFEAELRSKAAEMERFTYTVSHDLKSPLITIKSFVAMIERDLAAGRLGNIPSDLARVAKATDKMNRLLDELLALSRVGRVVNTFEKVSFEALVHEALEAVAGRIQERGIRVEVAEGLPEVWVDRVRMVEVLQNLIDNAAKYMGDQPEPLIAVERSPDLRENEAPSAEMRFVVRDNGMGIEPRYHERVFGLFDKLDPKSEGSGAGLALVRRIVETHGGRTGVESEGPGKGCSFWFTLKRAENRPESKQGGAQ